jgi:hypothetical protein
MKVLASIKNYILNHVQSILKNLATIGLGIASGYYGVLKYQQEKTENIGLSKKNDLLIDERRLLRRTLDEIVVKVVSDNYDVNDIPMPMGYKIYDKERKSFTMVKVNNSYIDRYGISNIIYFGEEDKKIHKKYGEQYYNNDIKVINGQERIVWSFYENTSKDGNEIGKFLKWKITKGENEYLYFLQVE